MKRRIPRMTLLFAILLSFLMAGATFAEMRYVSGLNGNDNWDGKARSWEGGTRGPKETINAAVEVSSATGDSIEVNYAEGWIYPEANAANIPLNPPLQMSKQLTFGSFGGAPTVDSLKVYANTTFIGPFKVLSALVLADGQVTGGEQLTMQAGSWVTRDLGSVLSGRLQFAGLVNFMYIPNVDVTTGLEMPFTADVGVIDTLRVTGTTLLRLNEDKTMNGIVQLDPATSLLNLGGHILTLNFAGLTPPAPLVHMNGGDIVNGLMTFNITGPELVVLPDPIAALPDITVNSPSNTTAEKLIISSMGQVGILTANGTSNIDVQNAGDLAAPIAGVINNGTGTIDLQRAGDLYINATGDLKAYSGLILFSHASGPTGVDHLGNVLVDGGTVAFGVRDDNVIIHGNGDFFQGVWDLQVGTSARLLQLGGENYRFGKPNLNVDFSAADSGPAPVHMLVMPIGLVTAQTINGNKPGSIWHGTFETMNGSATSPAVRFVNGHFRILYDVTFTDGIVQTDNCIVSIGNDIPPYGNGNFFNASGFTGINGGYVAMNGQVPQNMSGPGDFGNIQTNNMADVLVTGPIVCREAFYLAKGIVRGPAGIIQFNNATTPPHIVRERGEFESEPLFATRVDVEYGGNEKNNGWELPQGAQIDQLNDLLIKTQNNSICANGYGWVRFAVNANVHGNLVIDPLQALIINDSRTIGVFGDSLNIEGYLVTVRAGKLQLNNPTGTTIVTQNFLPTIVVADQSIGNKITAMGIVDSLQAGVFDAAAAFCNNDFPAQVAAMTPGDISFLPNAPGDSSSLQVTFTDPLRDHIENLWMAPGGALTLNSNMSQEKDLTLTEMSTVDINEFDWTVKGANIMLTGTGRILGTTGTMFYGGTDQYVSLFPFSGFEPVIDANVEVNLTTSLFDLLDAGADSLAITKDFTLRKGDVQLGNPSPTKLGLLGKNFHLHDAGSVIGPGVLYLNSADAPMNWYIYQSPELNNLTVQNSVDVLGNDDDYRVTVNGNYRHEDGIVSLGPIDLIIANTGSFARLNGTYEATTGYLIQRSPAFDQGSGGASFEIPNFRIVVMADFLTAGTDSFKVTKRMDLFNGGYNRFWHKGFLQIENGVTFRYASGSFDVVPNYFGTIRLIGVHSTDITVPAVVWPEDSGIVTTLEVMTGDTTTVKTTKLTLDLNHSLPDTLLLRNGKLAVTSGKALTFTDGLTIIRVDGSIDASSSIIATGTDYIVIYANYRVALTSGPELPAVVNTLTFTRWRNKVNAFTTINKPVLVAGLNTLNIRNNVQTLANSKITVLGDVYFENESDVFPLATDPVCIFNSPLAFEGDRNQMVYVPKDGIDLRPTPNPLVPGPARIEINKDNPNNTVTVSGGNLWVDHITFVNGLLVTEDDNFIAIPAPVPGGGQGFDRSGVIGGHMSHIVGRVAKMWTNRVLVPISSNERQEFPVGSLDAYRPASMTFKADNAEASVPDQLLVNIKHVDTPPRGSKGLPLVDNCGVPVSTYSPFYWDIKTNGTYTQNPFDLELKADGLEAYSDVDSLRIVRRHGDPSETDNTWIIQGDCVNYDNAQYNDGPVVITENSKGGLRQEGAIFAIGLPSGDLPIERHFTPVWNGNPYKAMTFYITRAEFYNGNPLQPGDEVGVFDGNLCVGSLKLTDSASKTLPAIVIASADDPETSGKDGFDEDQPILYRVWDSKTGIEYLIDQVDYYRVDVDQPETNDIRFFGQSSTRAELLHGEQMVPGQDIFLTRGWNIFSLAVEPSNSFNMFDTSDPSTAGNGILNSIEPELTKVVGTNDGTIEKLLFSWINSIGNWDPAHGYYINVNQDVILHIPGTILQTPIVIDLHDKWNIISYPCFESEQNAMNVLQPLIDAGVLKKAMDQYGHALEKLAFVGWYNGIGNMKPGQGYYIYVNGAASFEITCPNQIAKPAVALEPAEPKHFVHEEGNPYKPMNFYVNDVTINGEKLQVGDEIAAYDGDVMVGSTVVEHELSSEKPLAVIAGMDDGSGKGFTKGNAVSFKVWKSSSNVEYDIKSNQIGFEDNTDGSFEASQVFEPRATARISIETTAEVSAAPEAFELKQNYPNPFNPSTTIRYAVPSEASVKVQIFDVTGKLVSTLVEGKQQAGIHQVEWTGSDSYGNKVATGVYFYKMTAGSYVETKKMLFTK
jgi:hypothetical protein